MSSQLRLSTFSRKILQVRPSKSKVSLWKSITFCSAVEHCKRTLCRENFLGVCNVNYIFWAFPLDNTEGDQFYHHLTLEICVKSFDLHFVWCIFFWRLKKECSPKGKVTLFENDICGCWINLYRDGHPNRSCETHFSLNVPMKAIIDPLTLIPFILKRESYRTGVFALEKRLTAPIFSLKSWNAGLFMITYWNLCLHHPQTVQISKINSISAIASNYSFPKSLPA